MSDNQIEKQMNDYLEELRSVEQELNTQLDSLAESIDKTYKSMKDMVVAITDLAVHSSQGFVSGRYRSGIASVGKLATGLIEAYNVIDKTRKHNKYLDKLLATKKAMAGEKKASLQRVFPILKKVNARMEKLLANEAAKTYSLNELDSSNACNMLMDNMDRFLDMYRTSDYLLKVSKYLDAEYAAWLAGNQTSGLQRPNYYLTNQSVMALLEKASGEKPVEAFVTAIDNPVDRISGSTIYYLMDSQLSATILASLSEKIDFVVSLPIPNNLGVINIIEGNEAISHYMGGTRVLKDMMDDSPEPWRWLKWPVIIFGIILVCYGLKESVLVGLVCAAIAFALYKYVEKKSDEALEDYVLTLTSLPETIHEDALADAGYVEEVAVDLEKRSVIEETFKSMF